MIARRDLLIGAACVGAASTAYALKPRKRLVLLSGAKIADVLPIRFGDWSAENSDGLVQPKEDGSLAATLYNEIVGRIYHSGSDRAAIMMLAAYGGTQSDLLQLHRPEACYPAVGFDLLSSVAATLRLPGGARLPVRQVVAKSGDRQENIVYWTRLGEFLPQTSSEQREVRLRTALEGFLPDGLLVRFSVVGEDSKSAFNLIDEFAGALLASVTAKQRPALIGTNLANQMDRSR